jgi:hypothetical protein
MSRRNRDVEASLLSKFQFSKCDAFGDDHRWVELRLEGIPVLRTCFSHTKENIGPVLWKKIAGQLKVRGHYLDEMIDCTKSRDDYYRQVREAPFPPWPSYLMGRLKK